MTLATDNLNCIKNLMQMMCCDGTIATAEKSFLQRAAKELNVQVDDWSILLNEVLKDNVRLYPIQNRDKAIATLKSLIVMSKTDGEVNSKEKAFAIQFAKSIGISKPEWKEILQDINLEHLFEPFTETTGLVTAIRDDFEKLDAFLKIATDNSVTPKTVGLQEFLATNEIPTSIVCFHAAENKDVTLTRCQMLLDKCGDKLICILTRYQGCQVKYLHEIGLKKCIIEPVYTKDITDMFKK